MFQSAKTIDELCKQFANDVKQNIKERIGNKNITEIETTIEKLQEYFGYNRDKLVTWFPQIPRKILKNKFGVTLHKQRGRNIVFIKVIGKQKLKQRKKKIKEKEEYINL